jgi:hypothetical protein
MLAEEIEQIVVNPSLYGAQLVGHEALGKTGRREAR